MVNFTHLAFGLAMAVALTSGTAVEPRLAHDKVVEFPQTVPDDVTGKLYLRYKPWLYIEHGCKPFPAVDSQGNVNDGLGQCDGNDSNECDYGKGQVYSRSAEKDGMFAIMYSWYFPKDVPVVCSGHRHDWENIVIWLSERSESAKYIGIAMSKHGDYVHYPQGSHDVTWEGDRPFISYTRELLFDHHPSTTTKKGDEQPLIAWEKLTKLAWDALQAYNFGEANLSFSDKNFDGLLTKSKMQ
ncbi:necrosis inducing protein (NPP1) domain-containing protein [Hirsutella rhossiliensis]|uniref:Necrosis inducing protein (NPP1) domain-containing protein n=1 Tax=Hirsutella rhossiliensis TaxID=111463 RepID=A0A9P8N4E2_9HYPO|nr:necrosis inducing protein (NPP1) domain-containing protein [Hirsutella rhossiliensis]KAH0966609.1 necrosis inducing protein (NPP1) domain-containing protein [Hirsutella rhossiliensis]